ncbi:hypothetical protein MKW94_026589 [Papaver nudicaule]|uniref:F-box domain-containing protein n=1 Tax=Papaver nudicaule TaxID=74823 RepID=A0AA41VMJ3_PAPNU|nr:hypothetical protein [Papaver nudicaule]
MDFGLANGDLCFEVLSRLQTKSLLELKLVSKQWGQLFSDLSFMQLHSQRATPIISGFFFQGRFQCCDDDIEDISYVPVDRGQIIVIRKNVLDFLPEKVVVMASSNGLICCRSCNTNKSFSAIYVCNPSSRQWVKLDWSREDRGIGLALVPSGSSPEFRLVNLHRMPIEYQNNDTLDYIYSFDIYSTRTGKWKTSEDMCLCKYNPAKNLGIYVSGILYWLTDGDGILAFDVENEKSHLIKLPVHRNPFKEAPEGCIGEFDGQLYYITIKDTGMQVWILENYYESEWVLESCISLDVMEQKNPDILYNAAKKMANPYDQNPWMDPLAFQDGLLLMKVCVTIVSYCLKTGRIKELCTFHSLGPNTLINPIVMPYSMSLVPLHHHSMPTRD